jgi:uncharacterized protein YndB with AHSA1/START domain
MEATATENRIELEHYYAHSIELVWKAISDADSISKWFIKADFEARRGYEYTFTHESTTVTGTVLEVDPPRLLVYTWIVGGTTAETVVRWELREQEGGTLLRIDHTGFEKYADAAPSMIKSSVGGWNAVAAELEKWLNGELDTEQD